LVAYYTNKSNGNASELFAEAELRVLSATVLDNSNGNYDADELLALYRNCTLNKPYMCGDASFVRTAGVGFYYSTVYLIARSDALMHSPGIAGDPLCDVAKDGAFISLNSAMKTALCGKRQASKNAITAVSEMPY
jgi:hypothetical protein